METVTVGTTRLEYRRLPSAHPRQGRPAIVFLHEGLGSVSMWRDFPQRVADATGCEAVAYSRPGYGRSDPELRPRTVRYLHEQGLEVLPAMLAALELERPILFGHSDGGSIALLCAGATSVPLAGLIVLAPHIMVEDVTIAGIRKTVEAARTSDIEQRLARHHSAVNAPVVFPTWHRVWLDPAFRDFNIEDCLPRIACPVLAVQGEDDEYATMAQIDGIAAQAGDVELLRLADCRHSPHKDQPQAVIDVVAEFVDRVAGD